MQAVAEEHHKQQQQQSYRPYVKKPLNAFMLFMKENREKVMQESTLKESAAINQILGRKVSLQFNCSILFAIYSSRSRVRKANDPDMKNGSSIPTSVLLEINCLIIFFYLGLIKIIVFVDEFKQI